MLTHVFLLVSAGFKGVYKKRTGNKLDGCATFYRASRLQMVECSLVEYFRNGVACLDRDNVAIVMVLRATATAKDNRPPPTLCVANTHLLYNTKRGDNKLAQLALLFAEIDRMSFRRCTEAGSIERCPVIVCGDFNLTPFSELYKFIIEGSLFYEGLLARVMSGQDYGAGSNFYMRREFLPVAAGIADTCQFVDELRKRVPLQCATEEEKATIGVKKLSVDRETGAEDGGSNSGAAEAAVGACSTGTLSHSLNLVSAYNHFWSSTHNHEVTTIQHGTVDYIMYSVGSKRTNRHHGQMTVDNVVENELYLTATLNVLLKSEMNALDNALPNDVNGSDHLLLAAKFLLQNPK
jgi:protein angel